MFSKSFVKRNQFVVFGTPFLLVMAAGSYVFSGISCLNQGPPAA